MIPVFLAVLNQKTVRCGWLAGPTVICVPAY